MNRTRADYNWQGSGRQVFYDGSTYESLMAMAPCQFYDDFTGADVVIPAAGAAESGCKWVYKDVSAVGAPAFGKVVSEVNGVYSVAMAITDEKEDAALYMGDQLTFSVAQGAIFEARVKLSALPTEAEDVANIGLWGAWGDGGSDYRVGFNATASGLINCECDDNSTDSGLVSSGVTATAAQWKIYRVDCSTQSNIKFFIDGVGVATTTTFNNAASAANAKCQPYLGMYKATGVGVASMKIDYVKIWQNRS